MDCTKEEYHWKAKRVFTASPLFGSICCWTSSFLNKTINGLLDKRHKLFSLHNKQNPVIPKTPTSPLHDGKDVIDSGRMDYRFEEARLRSFENWPSPHVHPKDLAAAGFYYTQQSDRVRCFECPTEICCWEEGDIPMSEHQRWGSRCRFVRKQPCGNVPVGVDPSTIPLPAPRGQDVCGLGPYRLDYRPSAEADIHGASSSTSHQQGHLPSVARLGILGINVVKKPDHPNYTSYEARLQTYSDWPISMAQSKEQMAEAGFFYLGTGDKTSCYHCGGGIRNWEPQDDPWVTHAKWFSTCSHVRLVKGQEFIDSVTGRQVAPLSGEETRNLTLPSFIKKVEPLAQQKQRDSVFQLNKSENNTSEQASTSTQNNLKSLSFSESGPGSCAASLTPRDGQRASRKGSLSDARVCKICYNEELSVVFLPCGHIVACDKCAPGMTTCALCRQPVTMTVRAFLA